VRPAPIGKVADAAPRSASSSTQVTLGAVGGLVSCIGARRVAKRRQAANLRRNAAIAAKVVRAAAAQDGGKALKVVIAGGGVGGLFTAFCMLKEGMDVTVYEKTSKFARFGGPIQLASNATSTIKAMDERLFDRVMSKFTFTASRRCGIKDGLRSDGSFRMTDVMDPGYLANPDSPADWFVSFPLKECADFFKLPYTGVINRPDLQDILLDECSKMKPDFLVNGAPVMNYTNHDEGVTVHLSDGTKVEADVLVGSDGIWSAVRAQMYDEGEIKKYSDDKWARQGCPYSGYTVFAGETVLKLPDYYETGYKVYIGPRRYFVTSDVGDGRVQWYAFLCMEPGTEKAGDTWDGTSSSKEEGNNVISYLKAQHEGWSDEVFHVLENTLPETVEQRDLYDRWPEFLRSWADGRTVLIGDAVHPMMPNLGQGGCQAIEDAYELTKRLKNLKRFSEDSKALPTASVNEALEDFYQSRVGRVAGVSLLSRLASELIIQAFSTPWSPHDNMGTDWRSYLTFAWKPVLQWMVFPLQFLFLYSYHPTGSMGSLPKRLEEEWRKRHKESAEKAFDHVAKVGQQVQGPSFFAKAEADSSSQSKAAPSLTPAR